LSFRALPRYWITSGRGIRANAAPGIKYIRRKSPDTSRGPERLASNLAGSELLAFCTLGDYFSEGSRYQGPNRWHERVVRSLGAPKSGVDRVPPQDYGREVARSSFFAVVPFETRRFLQHPSNSREGVPSCLLEWSILSQARKDQRTQPSYSEQIVAHFAGAARVRR
jgi:hypothetical protein